MSSTTDPFSAIIEAAMLRALEKAGPLGVTRRLYRLSEAAEYLGMSEEALRAKVATGGIPHVHIDRYLRFDKVALDRWIEAHQRVEELQSESAK